MVVYIDTPAPTRSTGVSGHGKSLSAGWCRMFADDPVELREAGTALHLPASWIQRPGALDEHFDLAGTKRQWAIARLSAAEISVGEVDLLHLCKRLGIDFELRRWRSDPVGCRRRLAQQRRILQSDGVPIRVRSTYRQPLPAGTVWVGMPSRWANPYLPDARTPSGHQTAVDRFRDYLARNPGLAEQARAELAGCHLACSCPLEVACHADVWLDVTASIPTGRSLQVDPYRSIPTVSK